MRGAECTVVRWDVVRKDVVSGSSISLDSCRERGGHS